MSASQTALCALLLIVAVVTRSAAASSVSDRAPPNTSTDSADARAGEIPIALASTSRARRRRWIAAECMLSAASRLTLDIVG